MSSATVPERASPAWRVSLWAVCAAFGTYFAMYAFRKPFTAAGFTGSEKLLGVDYKVILVTAQVIGYMLSKFIGIRVVAEMPPSRRASAVLVLILAAHAALVLFALVPPPWQVLCLLLNGLPLGMIFSLVLSVLEGRRATEALSAGLCAAFILADGVMKSLGTYLLEAEIAEAWMPATAGAVFLPIACLGIWMLHCVPPPTPQDVEHRAERAPMSGTERRAFFRRYALGLSLILLAFLLTTILRSIRADFAPELWRELQPDYDAGVFTRSELAVMFGVVIVNGLSVLISDNRRAFHTALGISIVGFLLLAGAVTAQRAGWIDGFTFMVSAGLGLYLPYVAVHTTIFERLIALTRDRGTIGFLMCLADAFGYLGYVGVMICKNFIGFDGTLLDFFLPLCLLPAVVAAPALIVCAVWFERRVPHGGSDGGRRTVPTPTIP